MLDKLVLVVGRKPHSYPATRELRLLPVLLTDWLSIGGFYHPLLEFHEIAKVAHRTQENSFLLDYKFNRNSQMEEMHRTRYVGTELPGPLWALSFQDLHVLTNLETL